MPERLFVYGTLRSGERNHTFVRGLGLVSSEAARASGFDLYHLDPEGYPAVVVGSGVVVGELLTLTGGLRRLDRLEGVDRPRPRYARVRHTVEVAGANVEAWLYLYLLTERLRSSGALRIRSGDWPNR